MNFPRAASPSVLRRSSTGSSSAANAPSHRVHFPDHASHDPNASQQPRQQQPQSRRCPNPGHNSPRLNESTFSRIVQLVEDVFTAALALGCIVGVSTFMAVLNVVVRPFSVTVYRRLTCHLAAASWIDAIALLLPNTRIVLTGDSDLPTPIGTSLIVANHLIDGDWWAVFLLGRCIGLRGSIKVFLRNEYLNVALPTDSHATNTSGSNNNTTAICSTSSASATTTTTTSSSTSISPTAAATAATVHYNKTNGTGLGANGNGTHRSGSGSTTSPGISINGISSSSKTYYPQDLSILAKLLHLFLEFPLINGEDYSSNREQLLTLLRSFAEPEGDSAAPIHLLFFPEGWSQHNGSDRASIHKISNEFAQREDRPQLKHLLLPRARNFNSSLECLRESSPVVYDLTMANIGYNGSLPPSVKLSAPSLWKILRRTFPREIHVRIKKYSIDEVLLDRTWLDQRWAEKDRLLSHFARNQHFPVDGRNYSRHRVLNSRFHNVEGSIMSTIWLFLIPITVPILLFLSVPLIWTMTWIWIMHKLYRLVFPDATPIRRATEYGSEITTAGETGQTPGSASDGTPFMPATPFVSPSVTSWRDLFSPLNKHHTSRSSGGGS